MGFSAHEMLIFLRARDEASRILGRFARNVQGVNTKTIATNNSLIASYVNERSKLQATAVAARQVSKEKIAALNKTMTVQRHGIKIQQSEIAAVQLAKTKEIIDFKERKAAVEEMYSSDIAMMRKMIAQMKKDHEAQKLVFDNEIAKRRQVVNTMREQLRMHDQLKSSVVRNGQTTKKNIDAQIQSYKELEAQARAANRQEVAAAKQKAANTHRQVQGLQNTGIALTTMGASATIAGSVTVSSLSDAAQAAIDYKKAATTTLTQVDDKFKTTLEDIVNIGRSTADRFAVPIDEMQGAMYDLYSSMDVKNKTVASNFMVEAAKAAVGGSTDVKTATNSLISILNSYELKAKDVNKVNDLMFQLVRKGVGSYNDFTQAMATANPSAHRANQTYQQTAAMLALMTRNGIKSAKAGTYAARAFDAISNVRTADNMKEFGIKIYDATGKLKPMTTIIELMRNKLKGLNDEQRNNALKGMFAGSGGTIQAMKFFNTALSDTDGTYKQLYKDMMRASKATDENGRKVGAAQIAYEQMAGTDASRILIAQNKMAIAWQKIGDAILPVKTAVYEFFGQIADWWNKLSPQQQQGIAQFAAIAAVILIVGGVIVTLVGGVMLLVAAVIALEAAALPIIAITLAVIAVFALLAAAAVWVITNWDQISKFFTDLVNNVWNTILAWGASIGNFFNSLWSTYIQPALNGLWEALQTAVATALAVVIAIFTGKWGEIPSLLASAFAKIVNFLSDGFANQIAVVRQWLTGMRDGIISTWNGIVAWVKNIPNMLIAALGNLGMLLYKQGQAVLQGFLDGLRNIWNNITSWIGDIGKWISDHKGPLSYDLKLLQPHGRAVMTGFNKTLAAGMEDTKKLINNFNPEVAGIGMNSKTPVVAGYGLSASGATIHMPIYTQEIDPVKHAADLGYEVSQRLGL